MYAFHPILLRTIRIANRQRQGNHENRIYRLRMECGQDYPRAPPKITFITMINLPGVHETKGTLDNNKIEFLRLWESTWDRLAQSPKLETDPLSIEAALGAVRKFVFSAQACQDVHADQRCGRHMEQFKRLPQPDEGTVYDMYKDEID